MTKSVKGKWFTNGERFIKSQYNNFNQYAIRNIISSTIGWIGTFPNKKIAYKPSKIGYIFLKGIENTYAK